VDFLARRSARFPVHHFPVPAKPEVEIAGTDCDLMRHRDGRGFPHYVENIAWRESGASWTYEIRARHQPAARLRRVRMHKHLACGMQFRDDLVEHSLFRLRWGLANMQAVSCKKVPRNSLYALSLVRTINQSQNADAEHI
jgi:hypothetical protein